MVLPGIMGGLLLGSGGSTAYRATFSQWLAGGVRLNYSSTTGQAQKWPALFIG